MAKRTKKVGVTGKYGTRYGSSLRKVAKKAEISQHARYTCAFCGKDNVKRHSVGIWNCKSCNKTLAGGAYTLAYVLSLPELPCPIATFVLTAWESPERRLRSSSPFGDGRLKTAPGFRAFSDENFLVYFHHMKQTQTLTIESFLPLQYPRCHHHALDPASSA
ncbi:60S ribosomal protein L43 [Ceratocystis lukuohia]|uniref:60S ribosomal protein L43 n=1 Tax=Ceratocystis lukuohia TaxID=2019550 RepID=A0ABR4ME30_9PEZI